MLMAEDALKFEAVALKAFVLEELLGSAADGLAALAEQSLHIGELDTIVHSAQLIASEVRTLATEGLERQRAVAVLPACIIV